MVASSARAATNIALTVSTICLWSTVRLFSWTLAVETFGENISAKATVAKGMYSRDGMKKNLLLVVPVKISASKSA
jgi:hypothetical protein